MGNVDTIVSQAGEDSSTGANGNESTGLDPDTTMGDDKGGNPSARNTQEPEIFPYAVTFGLEDLADKRWAARETFGGEHKQQM